ncbi:SHOCT domain-containing protein [Lentisalinibacter salinarum]|uniref:SHOCT domain-containing protein n=1 Tax=Lentisalinibacter salinarum TaxID=2992239 RepID=UPI003864026C
MTALRTSALPGPALLAILIALTILVASNGSAQSTDTATERARLANERIQLEAQRRAEEERRRQERESGEAETPAQAADSSASRTGQEPPPRAAPAGSETAAAPSAAPPPLPPADDDRISRTLEQLRELGELRDAGYVTDEEFERIKTRILDSRF